MTFKKITGLIVWLSLQFFIPISICLVRIVDKLHSYYVLELTERNELEVNFQNLILYVIFADDGNYIAVCHVAWACNWFAAMIFESPKEIANSAFSCFLRHTQFDR